MGTTHEYEREQVAQSPVVQPPAAKPAPALTVGSANDAAEHAADKAADAVLRRLGAGAHQHAPGCGHETLAAPAPVQRRESGSTDGTIGAAGGSLDDGSTSLIESRRGKGRALDPDLRRHLEPAFGRSLADVRVHNDTTSKSLAAGMNAEAFTTGKDIFLTGQPTLHTLAHEIAHTQQQDQTTIGRKLSIGKKFRSLGKGIQNRLGMRQRGQGGEGGQNWVDNPMAQPPWTENPLYDDTRDDVSEPVNGRAMTKMEQQNVPSMKELIQYKEWQDKVALIKSKSPLQMTPEELGQFKTGERSLLELEANSSVPEMSEGMENLAGFGLGAKNQKKSGDIFPIDPKTGKMRLPKPEDVKQTALGDCYLEAALSALARTDPEAIVDMFTDYGDGTVAVRLYEVDATSTPHKLTPRQVHVDKGRFEGLFGVGLADRGKLWVSLIERAYAAGGHAGDTDDEQKLRGQRKPKANMVDIESGSGAHALEVLTGKNFVNEDIEEKVRTGGGNIDGMPWDGRELAKVLKAKKDSDPPVYTATMFWDMFGQDPKKVERWTDWCLKEGGLTAFNALFAAHDKKAGADEKAGNKDLSRNITLDEIAATMENAKAPGDLVQAVLTQVKPKFAGKRGSGNYSQAQLDLFDRIAQALSTGEPVTMGTKKKIARGGGGSGVSSGEETKAGLAGGHEYSVIAVKEEKGLKYVQMRNPWGFSTREYQETEDDDGKKRLKAKGVQDGMLNAFVGNSKGGVSWFELSDVARRFDTFSHLQ